MDTILFHRILKGVTTFGIRGELFGALANKHFAERGRREILRTEIGRKIFSFGLNSDDKGRDYRIFKVSMFLNAKV